MTREEAIEILKIKRECMDYEGFSCAMDLKTKIDGADGCNLCERAIDMAIEALSTERLKGRWQWKLRMKGGFHTYTGVDSMGETHTITVDERHETEEPYCPICGKWNDSQWLDFCPNCGCDMRGEEE